MSISETRLGKIERLDLIVIKLPFVQPFATSTYTWAYKEALLLKLTTDGLTGWGECVADPDPFYSPETTVTARHIIKDFLLPLVAPGITLGELDQRFRHVRGHGMAKATVENALIDLIAKQNGLPLHQFLGWPRRKIMSGISIGLQPTQAELLANVAAAVAKKYQRIKIKIKRGQDLEWVRTVREHFPDIQLMVDANGDYRLEDAAQLQQLDAFRLMMIEQPLGYDDIYQHSQLQPQLTTPLCLDESIHHLEDAQTALALGSCRIINIKQGRVGGLMEALRIAEFAAARGCGVWSGGMDESGIGRAVNIHLQAATTFNLPGDTSETARYFQEDLVDPPVVLDAEGLVEIPPGAGIGVQIIPDRLRRYTLHEERLI
ncbi:o-succinylbenzoate synthase [candidate division KSB1 bacterium]|nr:o-succinylbenzoate synthase [candidate division KSB1 bacterium]